MKVNELIQKKLIKKIDDKHYLCKICKKEYTKRGISNHYYYSHEEEGIKKRKDLSIIAKENNNKPEMKLKISKGTKKAFKRESVQKNFAKHVNRMKIERKGEGNPMYGRNHTDEWKKQHSKQMKDFKMPIEAKEKIRQANLNKKHKPESIKKMRDAKIGKKDSRETRLKKSESAMGRPSPRKLTVKIIKEKYSFFYKIEQPIQIADIIFVECKNCNKLFTPEHDAFKNRIWALEKSDGNDGAYLYCSQHCKDTCELYNLHGDPYKNNNLPYTPGEIQVYNKNVLDRENGLCEYCGEPATHVHHIYPKKLEPFFALDPDYGVACCEKHHYKYGHKEECSTGNLAKIVCSVESQKFLNQTLEDI